MIAKRKMGYALLGALVLFVGTCAVFFYAVMADIGDSMGEADRNRGIGELPTVAEEEPKAEEPGRFDRGDNGVWMRRHWIHGGSADQEAKLGADTLANRLESLGIRRIYPFLGPMDEEGRPGWRDDGQIRHYEPERARAFFEAMHEAAPGVQVVPWSGGVLDRDVRPEDADQRAAYAREMAKFVSLGADGVHINVEPLPSYRDGYLELLREVKAAIGPDKTLSIAAYPPTTPLHPFPQVHWTLEFTREVCEVADELVVMGYDTALTGPDAYEGLMADWTADLAGTLHSPEQGGCEWLMGVPAYEDDEAYHRPDVENMTHGIAGTKQGLARLDTVPDNFRGIAVYASWTTDAEEWTTYQRDWRGLDEPGRVLPDYDL